LAFVFEIRVSATAEWEGIRAAEGQDKIEAQQL